MQKQAFYDKITKLGEKIAEIENREFSNNLEVAERQADRRVIQIGKIENEIELLKGFVCRSNTEFHKTHKIKYDNMKLACYYCGFVTKRF